MMAYNNATPKTVSAVYQSLADASRPFGSQQAELSSDDVMLMHDIWQHCCNFLDQQHLLKTDVDSSATNIEIGLESLSSSITPNQIGASAITDLVRLCKIPANLQQQAVDSVNLVLAKFIAAKNSSSSYAHVHFGHGRDNADLQRNVNECTNNTYAPGVMGLISSVGMPAMEAFGATIDRVLPDIRSAMAIRLMSFHKGLNDRLIHRRVSDTPYVKYVVPYAEFYDMLLSNHPDNAIRNEGDHRQPFINLYADAAPVSNELQPIVPLMMNDINKDKLLFDGACKLNVEVNLFDLSRLANEFGKSHTNYSDLVSEGAVVDSLIVKFKKDATEETYQISVRDTPGARLNMYPNASDSGDRAAVLRHILSMNSESTDITGKKSTLFANFTGNDYVRVALGATIEINLKTSTCQGYASGQFAGFNSANAQIAAAAEADLKTITMEVLGYILDARYSEENLRRSNLAIQTNVRTLDYEISNGRNILVDFSLQQEAPDEVMKFVTEASSLGQDHKMLDIVTHTLLYIYDRNHEESHVPGLQGRLTKLGYSYAAGMKVRPTTYMAVIDLTAVETIRSSDILGDIRQLVEWELLNLVSLLFQNSYYKHQLDAGETPQFKCCTSNVIIDNLLSIPHIHNHLNKSDDPSARNSDGVEFRRVLPNGAILDCVSTTFNTMRDKMFVIPYRENNPDSDLNFGHNWDFGVFVANYTPQTENDAKKRVISNCRTQVIPTNPIGLYIKFDGLDTIINMFAKGAPTKSKLPNPSDLVVPVI